jgi:hypothetical protein
MGVHGGIWWLMMCARMHLHAIVGAATTSPQMKGRNTPRIVKYQSLGSRNLGS